MSPEPKPRSMAAVTITVNSTGATAPVGRYEIWLNAGTSEYLAVLPARKVTICRVRTISRKGHSSSEKWNPQRPYARPLATEDEMVRPARRRAERGRTEMTTPQLFGVE